MLRVFARKYDWWEKGVSSERVFINKEKKEREKKKTYKMKSYLLFLSLTILCLF